MAIDLDKIELRKQNVLDLKKKSGLGIDAKAQVVLALDFSGSMNTLYGNGTVQDVVERVLPFGIAFDDNKEVDFYLFHDGAIKMEKNITLSNLDGYINKRIIGHYQMGGTNYAPVLEKLDDLEGRTIDNVNFLKVSNIATIPDNQLYGGLMAEYPDWVSQAKGLNLID